MTTLKRAWQRLTRATPGKTQAELAEKYTHFQALLSANNQVLTLMADMEEKLSGDYLFDLQYIRAAVSQLHQETGKLVDALNGLGGNRYQGLSEALARISREVEEVLTRRREIPAAPLVIDFEALNATMGDVVGGKNANLGEVKNRVGLPVPAGFAISTYAYKVFLDHNHLAARLTELLGHWRLDDLDSLARVSEDLKQMILAAQVPPDLEAAITEAYERLAARERRRPLVAMRSSAVGEDLTLTFAGQYATYLNVAPESLVSRYKDILASLFTPRALFYYKNKGFKEEEMAMGVVVMPMVQARASGVLFTRQPDAADQEAALHQRGLGPGQIRRGRRHQPGSLPGGLPAAGAGPGPDDSPQGGHAGLPAPGRRRGGAGAAGAGQRPLPGPGPDCTSWCSGPPPWRPISPNPRTWSGPWMKPATSGCSRAGRCSSRPRRPRAAGPDPEGLCRAH